MYATCLHCTRDLGRNAMIETLPIGRRLAFDADKGRLWVVCASCGKWNLVPFDTRLESIDACERLFRDTRTRYSTDNIGMAKVGDGLTLVRVGRALRPEFASWRYGEQYKKRRRQVVGVGLAVGAVVTAGILGASAAAGIGIGAVGGSIFQLGRLGYGAVLYKRSRLKVTDPANGEPVVMTKHTLRGAIIGWDDDTPSLLVPRRFVFDDTPSLLVPRRFVFDSPSGKSLHDALVWRGAEMPAVGRRVASALNLTTGSSRELKDAVGLLAEHHGDLQGWLTVEAQRQRRNDPRRYSSPVLKATASDYWADIERLRVKLTRVEPAHRLALEMWFSEDIERRWLEGELRLLEREWREAERLAKIADDLVLEPTA